MDETMASVRLVIKPVILNESLLLSLGVTTPFQPHVVNEPPSLVDLLACRLWAYFNGPYRVSVKDGRPLVEAES